MLKKLLKKELTLSINSQMIVMMAFLLLSYIPFVPILTGLVYGIVAVNFIFPIDLANRDIEFTSILPIKKNDIVKSKVLFISFIQILSIFIVIPAILLRIYVYPASMGEEELHEYMATCPTLMAIGYMIAAMGLYNIIVIPAYYKNPIKKITVPQLIGVLGSTLLMTVGFILDIIFRTSGTPTLVGSIFSIPAGVILYIVLIFIAVKRAQIHLSNFDL